MTFPKPVVYLLASLVASLIGVDAEAGEPLIRAPQQTFTHAGPTLSPASPAAPPGPAARIAASPPRIADPEAVPPNEAKAEVATERYPDGAKKIERHVILDAAGNYVNHGTCTLYDHDGKVLKTGEFRNGKQHGPWKHTFATDEGHLLSPIEGKDQFAGPFVSEATFAEGKLHGTWSITDGKGQKVVEWNFQEGARHGQSNWWYPGGAKWMEATYKNGLLDGQVRQWDADGKTVNETTYVEGKCVTRTVGWYALGQKEYEGFYLRDPSVAELMYDWWTASATAPAPRAPHKDQKHGLWVSWYRNGSKKTEGQYDHDLPAGKFTWWYENGQQQAEGEYQAGVKCGSWITWHANGLKESQGEYKNGAPIGKWMRWDAEGKLVSARDFPAGDESKTRTGASPRPIGAR